jgi:hypothetical protein
MVIRNSFKLSDVVNMYREICSDASWIAKLKKKCIQGFRRICFVHTRNYVFTAGNVQPWLHKYSRYSHMIIFININCVNKKVGDSKTYPLVPKVGGASTFHPRCPYASICNVCNILNMENKIENWSAQQLKFSVY